MCVCGGGGGGLKKDFTAQTSLLGCEMVQNSYLVVRSSISSMNQHTKQINRAMIKQKRGLNRYNVLRDRWRSLGCKTTSLEI